MSQGLRGQHHIVTGGDIQDAGLGSWDWGLNPDCRHLHPSARCPLNHTSQRGWTGQLYPDPHSQPCFPQMTLRSWTRLDTMVYVRSERRPPQITGYPSCDPPGSRFEGGRGPEEVEAGAGLSLPGKGPHAEARGASAWPEKVGRELQHVEQASGTQGGRAPQRLPPNCARSSRSALVSAGPCPTWSGVGGSTLGTHR